MSEVDVNVQIDSDVKIKNKKDLRVYCRRKIREISPEEVSVRSGLIAEKVCSLLAGGEYNVIGAYFSYGKEVATGDLIRRLLVQGYNVALPVIPLRPLEPGRKSRQKRYSDDMEFRGVTQIEDLVTGAYGILEPPNGRVITCAELGVLLIPGLAFTRSGRRLGKGGGYYDRYLSRLSPDTLLIGLAFSEQILTFVPATDHDFPVHLVITEKEIIRCSEVSRATRCCADDAKERPGGNDLF